MSLWVSLGASPTLPVSRCGALLDLLRRVVQSLLLSLFEAVTMESIYSGKTSKYASLAKTFSWIPGHKAHVHTSHPFAGAPKMLYPFTVSIMPFPWDSHDLLPGYMVSIHEQRLTLRGPSLTLLHTQPHSELPWHHSTHLSTTMSTSHSQVAEVPLPPAC